MSCLEGKHIAIVGHLFRECDIIEKFLQLDKSPFLSCDSSVVSIDVLFSVTFLAVYDAIFPRFFSLLKADLISFFYKNMIAQVTIPAAGRKPLPAGYVGHITQICNKLVQLGSSNDHIQAYLLVTYFFEFLI